jgi:MFS family permease
MKHSPQRIGLKPYGDEASLETTQAIDQSVRGVSFTQATKTIPYWLIGFIRFGSMLTFQLISVHIYPHVVDIGISEIVAATIISITAASGTVSRLLAGFVADRIGNRLTMVLSAIILILSLLGLLFAREIWHFYGFALFFGVAWGGIGVAQVTLIAELFGPRSLGAIIGSLELFLTLGGATGVWLAGIIFDATGSYTVPFIICLIQAALVTIFGTILIFRKHKGEVY